MKQYKRPELKNKLTHILIFTNNGKAFPSLDGTSA